MEEKKTKKKLTLTVSSKKPVNVSNYLPNKKTKSVIIEKKPTRRWGEKKFQTKESNVGTNKSNDYSASKKAPINRNFDIRKMAEERATKRFKSSKEDILQPKKVI